MAKKIPAGTVHCFTCGYTATLPEMISYIYGYDDSGAYGTKWLIKNFLSIDIEDRKPLDLKLSRNSNHSEQQYVPEKQLDRYRYYHDYMFKRGLTEELIEKYDIGYDPKFKLKKNENTFPCITFPVRDMQGQNSVYCTKGNTISSFTIIRKTCLNHYMVCMNWIIAKIHYMCVRV